jgi:hypothetical protein
LGTNFLELLQTERRELEQEQRSDQERQHRRQILKDYYVQENVEGMVHKI